MFCVLEMLNPLPNGPFHRIGSFKVLTLNIVHTHTHLSNLLEPGLDNSIIYTEKKLKGFKTKFSRVIKKYNKIKFIFLNILMLVLYLH